MYLANLAEFSALFFQRTWCLKITEKVSFNIASEASYDYILSGLVKLDHFWPFLINFCPLKI